MDWRITTFTELTRDELYDVLSLRNQVFVVEQRCAYLDVDGRDKASRHVMAHEDGRLLAYCRFLPPEESCPDWTIWRVVVAPSARGRGLGHDLMRRAIAAIQQAGGTSIHLSGQAHLRAFYESHGFTVVSAPYGERIPHLSMRWTEGDAGVGRFYAGGSQSPCDG